MMKYIILLTASFWVSACTAHDEHYYSLHPSQLQKALTVCSKHSSSDLTCAQLKEIALHINKLAYELRLNPQEFGKQILSLQENIAQQESTLKKGSPSPELDSLLIENKQNLKQRLAIVKWLESPVS